MIKLNEKQKKRLILLQAWTAKELELLFMGRRYEAKGHYRKIARLGALEWLKSLGDYEAKAIMYFINEDLVRDDYQPDNGGACINCGASVWREWYSHTETGDAVKVVWRDCDC